MRYFPLPRPVTGLRPGSTLQAASLSLALLLILCNLSRVAVAGISGYQRFVAPALGIHCGYAHAMHAESCSAFTKRTLAERGMLRGLPLAMARFRACAHTHDHDPRLASGARP